MYISYMTQLFKTANAGIISEYFTCYCKNIIAITIHVLQGFVM